MMSGGFFYLILFTHSYRMDFPGPSCITVIISNYNTY